MPTIPIKLTSMAHGGAAMGKDAGNRAIFVPYSVPGETVQIEMVKEGKRFAKAKLLNVMQSSPDRVEPKCRHFTICGGCHFQHINYQKQLSLKQQVVADQLARIGGITEAAVLPVMPADRPYRTNHTLTLSPLDDGGVGLWSPLENRVIPIAECHLVRSEIQDLLTDLDINLPELRKLNLRCGSDGALLAVMQTHDDLPPEIGLDFPLSVALVLPEGIAANLIGNARTILQIKERPFAISPGVYFPPRPSGMVQVVDTVLEFADLSGTEKVLELASAAGILTAFLAPHCADLTVVETNTDAISNLELNLQDVDNVTVYQAGLEEIMPALPHPSDLIIANPQTKLTTALLEAVTTLNPANFIQINTDVNELARNAGILQENGYHLAKVQPIDMEPQTFRTLTVGLWQRAN